MLRKKHRPPSFDGIAPQRPRVVRVQVERQLLRNIYIGSMWLCAVSIFLTILVGLSQKSAAEANLYPEVCLGGWNNPSFAEGVPEVSDAVTFTSGNSASISGALAEIYCGNFSGDIPEGTAPTALEVHLSWGFTPQSEVVHVVSEPENVASSTGSVLDAPPDAVGVGGSAVESSSTPQYLVPDTSASEGSGTETPADTAPAEVVPATSPDAPPDVAPDVPPDTPPVPQDTSPDTTESAPQSLLSRALALVRPEIAHAQETSTTSEENSTPAPIYEDALFEVSYTLDGTTWNSLGTVTRFNLEDADFTIPLTGIVGWSDLSALQVRVRTLSSPSEGGTAYLDGMTLVVSYADTPVPEKETPQPYALTDGAVIPESNLPSVIVHPEAVADSNVIFYARYDTSTTYTAETLAHGDGPLDEYYAPLPPPGKYSMIQYVNDGGSYGCSGISADECEGDPHFVERVDFEVTDATTTP